MLMAAGRTAEQYVDCVTASPCVRRHRYDTAPHASSSAWPRLGNATAGDGRGGRDCTNKAAARVASTSGLVRLAAPRRLAARTFAFTISGFTNDSSFSSGMALLLGVDRECHNLQGTNGALVAARHPRARTSRGPLICSRRHRGTLLFPAPGYLSETNNA